MVQEALDEAHLTFQDIDAVGVTYGPGLVGALLVGLQYAKSLAYALNIPLIGVNHIEGHISANFIEYKELGATFANSCGIRWTYFCSTYERLWKF